MNFPNIRIERQDTECPLFVTDAVNATEQSLWIAKKALGLLDTDDFKIIQGCENLGQGGYTEGVVYLYGYFYKAPAIAGGKYYAPVVTEVENKLHKDANTYPTYKEYSVTESNIAVAGGSPLMGGDMNEYRISNAYLKSVIKENQETNWATANLLAGWSGTLRYRRNAIGNLEIIASLACSDHTKTKICTLLSFAPTYTQRFLILRSYLNSMNYDFLTMSQGSGDIEFSNSSPVTSDIYTINQTIFL